mgnify:CR=1 FL=1
MSKVLKKIMVDKFEELTISTDSVNRTGGWFDVEDGRIKSFELIASSVYEYVTNSNGDSTKIISTTTGIITPPGTALSDISKEPIMVLGNEEDIKSTIVSSSTELTPLEVIQNVFLALDEWVVGWTTSFGDGTFITNSPELGPIIFTPQPKVADLCFKEIEDEVSLQDLHEDSYKDSLGIIAQYIQMVLSANVIAPYPMTGLVGPVVAYSGVTTTIWTFL